MDCQTNSVSVLCDCRDSASTMFPNETDISVVTLPLLNLSGFSYYISSQMSSLSNGFFILSTVIFHRRSIYSFYLYQWSRAHGMLILILKMLQDWKTWPPFLQHKSITFENIYLKTFEQWISSVQYLFRLALWMWFMSNTFWTRTTDHLPVAVSVAWPAI